MKITALSRTGVSVALSLLATVCVTPALAQVTSPLYPSLSLTPAVKERMFMRVSYVHAFIKTKSESARDVTGPVASIAELTAMANALPNGLNSSSATLQERYDYRKKQSYILAGTNVIDTLDEAITTDTGVALGTGALGTPDGIKSKAGDGGTIAVSLGYFLDDGYNWAVEALLLGAPLNLSVYGDGVNGTGSPNGVNGKELIKTKLLPPTVLLGRYFSPKDAKFRPYLGIGAMYAIFFDTKATSFLNDYVGGQTSVSTKNALGVGPFVGFQSKFGGGWSIGLNVGYVRLKSEATLTTRNTVITGSSGVLQDYGPAVVDAIQAAPGTFGGATAGGVPVFPNRDVTALLLQDLAKYRQSQGNGDGKTLGTYVRKQKNTFDNTILMFSVGRDF